MKIGWAFAFGVSIRRRASVIAVRRMVSRGSSYHILPGIESNPKGEEDVPTLLRSGKTSPFGSRKSSALPEMGRGKFRAPDLA